MQMKIQAEYAPIHRALMSSQRSGSDHTPGKHPARPPDTVNPNSRQSVFNIELRGHSNQNEMLTNSDSIQMSSNIIHAPISLRMSNSTPKRSLDSIHLPHLPFLPLKKQNHKARSKEQVIPRRHKPILQ